MINIAVEDHNDLGKVWIEKLSLLDLALFCCF
jgi:hypothetical protein